MKHFLILMCLTFCSLQTFATASKLKDLITIKGVRENPIIGYGLVIGLNGTGDGGGEITETSLRRMFQKLGLNPKKEITSKNVASVVVTAKLLPFARSGQKIDIVVSSFGEASSLAGGTLLVTPLKGGDGKIYAIASGGISIGGMKKGKGFATTGTIPGGAIVEREIEINFDKKKSLRLNLRHPDFTTAARVEKTLNRELGGKFAMARDSSTIDLVVPIHYRRKLVQLLAIIENFEIVQDVSAKIVINERTGTIVAGGDVLLLPVAISHGDLTIEISAEDSSQSKKDKISNHIYFMEKKTTLKELVKGLNAFGTTPDDLISIFQALKRNGSLIGEIEVI